MKRLFSFVLVLSMLLSLGAAAKTLTAETQGFGGPVKVELHLEDGKIVAVIVTGPRETPDKGGNAINLLPARIVAAGGPDVDVEAGATITSNAILNAVKGILALEAKEPMQATKDEPAAEEPKDEPAAEEAAEGEVLTGEGQGFGGTVKVQVTRADGKITKVEVVEHGETAGISDPAMEQMPSRIVEANSAEVDIVAGATMTSNAIIEAVKAALAAVPAEEPKDEPAAEEAAEGDVLTGEGQGFGGTVKVQVTRADGKITKVEVVEHGETAGISDPAMEQMPGRIVEANSAEVDIVAGATMTSNAIIEAVKAALAAVPAEEVKDEPATEEPKDEPAAEEAAEGDVLTGEGQGFGGTVKVQVTRADGKITKVEVVEHGETAGISDPAMEQMPGRIVEANSAEVDIVAGATMTSNAIIEAVKAALAAVPDEEVKDEPAAEEAAEGEVLTGEGQGFGGTVKVAVTRADGKITKVEVVEHGETAGISDPAMEQMPERIVEANSAEVDIVAGATMTSNAIIEAVKAALAAVPAEEVKDEPAAEEAAEGEVLTGEGQGFGGTVKVAVTRADGKITKVEVVEHGETAGISDPAMEQMPERIVEANSAEVDIVAGATMTSNAIIEAVKVALGEMEAPPAATEAPAPEPAEAAAAEAYIGFGVDSLGRIGPGKDDQDVQVYSVNEVYANAVFDAEGKILFVHLDQLEFATPNYDGDGMPHFTGYPGASYNYDENHDGTVDSVLEATEDTFKQEIAGWATKRDRGDAYRMGTGTWAAQADAFQALFVGKTVDEVEEWFNLYTAKNGRPLKPEQKDEEDQKKYDALSDEEKAMLADVTSSATMSLNDSHGNILAALRKAYDNRQPLTAQAESFGFGVDNTGRVGPGKDDQDVQVYSVNQVYATSLFDGDGRLTYLHLDQLEFATPNYDGDGMPHFTGYPGQSYNYDENHDGKVDSVLEATEDTFKQEIGGWATKRDRGDAYRMGTGTWAAQADAFQALFVGKTVEEIEEWFNLYTAKNGRPLKPEQKDEEDQKKYDALSDEEKAMLADVTSSATMSLNDSHGNIVAAIRQSFEKRIPLKLTIGE